MSTLQPRACLSSGVRVFGTAWSFWLTLALCHVMSCGGKVWQERLDAGTAVFSACAAVRDADGGWDCVD